MAIFGLSNGAKPMNHALPRIAYASLSLLTPAEAFNQAMAFTLYFELVNLAEENFRIRLLRERNQRHRNALAAGCDVVIHCNATLKEKQEAAEGLCALEGESLARADIASANSGRARCTIPMVSSSLHDRAFP